VTLCSMVFWYDTNICCLNLQGEVNGAGKGGIDVDREYRVHQKCLTVF